MSFIKIPIVSDLEIENFDGFYPNTGTNVVNAVIHKELDDSAFLTQRPGINLVLDASTTVAKIRGRGVYYWEATGAIYFVNDNTIYKNSYATVIGTITAGKDPVTFVEVNDKLVVLDQENNKGWTITTAGVLAAIASGFPADIVGGGAMLNGYLFVMSESGSIAQSANNDATTWNVLDVINAQREEDIGVYLTRQKDQIVAIGTKSIEVFSDVGNPVASTLRVRPDAFYEVGAIDAKSVINTGDSIYFLGARSTGEISLYKIKDLQLSVVSSPTITKYITSQIAKYGNEFLISSNTLDGREFVTLTLVVDVTTEYSPKVTLVLDGLLNSWSSWNTGLNASGAFPLVAWSSRTTAGTQAGVGIFSNGDVVEYSNRVSPTDADSTDLYVDTGYTTSDSTYISSSSGSTINISMSITLPEFSGETRNNKFLNKLELEGGVVPGDVIDSSYTESLDDTVYISWFDDRYTTESTPRGLNVVKRRKLTRLGRFNTRAFKFSYTGKRRVRLEHIELTYGESQYA